MPIVRPAYLALRWTVHASGPVLRARGLACAAIGLAVLTSPAPAQRLTPVTFPQRVRLSAPEFALHKYQGTLSRIDGDTLVVDDRRIPLRSLTALAVRTDVTTHWRWGAVLGAAAGAAGGGMACRRSNCQEADLPVHFSVLSAAAGAIVGILVGANVPRERWRSVPIVDRMGN